MRALISVSNKEGIVPFAQELARLGVEIISTGGSYQHLTDNDIAVTNVSDITKFQECLDGRVKTLHPAIHAGILAMRSNPEHMETLEQLEIKPIDLLVINLYPFKETISNPSATLAEAIENIDIGGPTMLRAGAKNYQDVAVVTDPRDYDLVLSQLKESGKVSPDTKFYLATKVFEETSFYDGLIAQYLREVQGTQFPEKYTIPLERAQSLRYGENPHQSACFYRDPIAKGGTIADCVQESGKELSYNNINDANAAVLLVKEFNEPCVVAIKHSTPCGVAVATDLSTAYQHAYDCDPQSIFGGIVATNQIVDLATAQEMHKIFLEVIIAKGFTSEALTLLKGKQNLRLLQLDGIDLPQTPSYTMRKVGGGMLVEEGDWQPLSLEYQVVTNRTPTERELADMMFAMKVCKHTGSNAIVFAKDGATLSVGGGQVSRVWAVEHCVNHTLAPATGGVMASDAFFPFPDSVELAGKAGITAIIQPGGSKADQSCIDACNHLGISMIFTGRRHFKH